MKNDFVLWVGVLLLVCATTDVYAHPHDLHWRYSGTTADLRAAAFDGWQTTVVVGDNGTILRSTDTVRWEPCVSGTLLTLRGAAHGKESPEYLHTGPRPAPDLFVVVGGDNTNSVILTSMDGIQWARQPLAESNVLHAVTYGAGVFVAVGEKGLILASADGTNWVRRPTGLNDALRAVTGGYHYEPGSLTELLVAVGDGGAILSSPDGFAWTHRFSGTLFDLSSVAGASIRRGDTHAYIAAGNSGVTLISNDGFAWTALGLPVEAAWNAVAVAGVAGNHATGIYGLVGGDGAFLTSDDAFMYYPVSGVETPPVVWNIPSSSTDEELLGLIHLYGGFLAVGRHGTIRVGFTWARHRPAANGHLLAGCYDNDRWVAVGEDGLIIVSPDALTWDQQASPTSEPLSSVSCGGGTCVAVGLHMTVATSTNRVDWTIKTLPTVPNVAGEALDNALYGNGVFVASGSYYQDLGHNVYSQTTNVLYWSSNGLDWQVATNFVGHTDQLRHLTFGNGTFLFLRPTPFDNPSGASSDLYSSTNGQTWTRRSVGFDPSCVVFGDSFFAAVGVTNTAVSVDGISWSMHKLEMDVAASVASYAMGMFVTERSANGADGLTLSDDGIVWAQEVLNQPYLANSRVSALARGPTSLLALGRDGVVFETGLRFATQLVLAGHSPSGMELVLFSQPNTTVQVEESADLESWTQWPPVFVNAVTTRFPLADNGATNRFFRISR